MSLSTPAEQVERCRLTNDCAAQRYVAAKIHVASDSQVIELNDCRNLLEALLELLDLHTT